MVRGSRQMKVREATQVAQFLGVAQEEVLRRAGSEGPFALAEQLRRGRPPRSGPEPVHRTSPLNDLIPICRSKEETPVGYTSRPPNLAGVRDAYAVYVEDKALAPRYEPGWLLYVHPHKPVTPHRDVAVRKMDGTMLIRQFGGWEGSTLTLRQLNPEGTLRLPRDEVAECHLIVGVDQEG
jgi:hypothetical protein